MHDAYPLYHLMMLGDDFTARVTYSAPPTHVRLDPAPQVAVRERQIAKLTPALADAGLNKLDPTLLVDAQLAAAGQTFTAGYVNGYSLPFQPTDYQRMLRNRLLDVAMGNNAKTAESLKAIELLGKTPQIGLYNDDRTLTIINKSPDEMRDAIINKLTKMLDHAE